MVASAAFAEFLKEQLAPLGPVTLRLMFGKTGVSREGVMLGTPSISAGTAVRRAARTHRLGAGGDGDRRFR